MADFTFKIEQMVTCLKEEKDGWKKECNLVSWNGNETKYDIREWNEDHTKMTRGITLTPEEMRRLVKAMDSRV